MKYRAILTCAAAILLAAWANHSNHSSLSRTPAITAPASRPAYPQARTVETIDDYHGTKVADPYRWLEDPESADTRAFVDAQNTLVREFVDGPTRDKIAARLTELLN